MTASGDEWKVRGCSCAGDTFLTTKGVVPTSSKYWVPENGYVSEWLNYLAPQGINEWRKASRHCKEYKRR